MLVHLDGGPLDGVAFEHAETIDKFLLVTDAGRLVRYEMAFYETGLEERQHAQYVAGSTARDFDVEIGATIRRAIEAGASGK